MKESIFEASLAYHRMGGRPGKLEVVPTKPCATQRDLSLAYSPGVAEPCRRIAAHPEQVYDYTNKGNLVAVITNGTAVLGLGDIGPRAGKPVMEGKAVLFKKFAGIDVYDIEIDAKDPDRFIAAVEAIAPTFGGINLEDIKGPECFYIERELTRRLDIPVFHDDQHGTAIIAGAAFLNACELTGRDPGQTRVVVNGAGAAGISCAKLFVQLGVKRENLILCDTKGVIYAGRTDGMNEYKAELAVATSARTLADALKDADCFIGCSVADAVTPQMLLSMARDPIVFAMANPDPEIPYELARATRKDAILATGRSDHPNQVNNVLGFPFIFRGALDTGARLFNDEMKLAAVKALATLAKEPVPEVVSNAYGGERFSFGREYLIPKPFDPRVLYWESVAVAEAAIKSGVARRALDLDAYRESLRQKVEAGRSLIAAPLRLAKGSRVRIAVTGDPARKLAGVVRRTINDGLAFPVVIGAEAELAPHLEGIPADAYEIKDPARGEHQEQLIELMRRQRPLEQLGVEACREELRDPITYGALLTEAGLTDGLLGLTDQNYSRGVRPILRYCSRRTGVSRVAGLHMLSFKDRALFFADTTLIADPSAEELAEIAMRSARVVRRLHITPRVAFVSYTSLSGRPDSDIAKLRRAYTMVRQVMPELECYPDVQADVALEPDRFRDVFPTQLPAQPANILIFPNLHAANAAFRLARVLGGGTSIGPMLLGLRRPANLMPRGSTEDEVLNMMVVTAFNAHRRRREILEGKAPAQARSHTLARLAEDRSD